MGRIEGKIAVVTGGGDGIGRAIGRRFAAEGANVLVAEINEANGQAASDELIAGGGDALFLRTDVRSKPDNLAMIAAAVERWGTVDILVNNAWGGGRIGRVENKSDELIAHGMNMAFYGPMWAMQAAFPHMKAQSWGRVINLCSLNGVNGHTRESGRRGRSQTVAGSAVARGGNQFGSGEGLWHDRRLAFRSCARDCKPSG